jgi:SAM-dependent methyltransferase
MKQEIGLKSPESLSMNELLWLIKNKCIKKFKNKEKFHWTFDTVFDASTIPELIYRTYLETRDIRTYLSFISQNHTISKTADIGCGFGRLLPVLSEFSDQVVGFERESNLILMANRLYPQFTLRQIIDLSVIPNESNDFDLIVLFTVLQHLTDHKVKELSKEISRVSKPHGFLFICEQTDSSDVMGNLQDEAQILQHGRTIQEYEHIFKDFTLIKSSKRINEPSYRRAEIGSYMLFKKQ